MDHTVSIAALCKFIRSKNASPFITTFDIFFDDERAYTQVKKAGVLTKELVARLYKIPIGDVIGIFYVDAAKGIKISILKPNCLASGDPGCMDTFGATQHIPLLGIEVPLCQ